MSDIQQYEPQMAEQDELLTVDELTARLGISEITFWRFAKFVNLKADGKKTGTVGRPAWLFSLNKVSSGYTLFKDNRIASNLSPEGQLKYATGSLVIADIAQGSVKAIDYLNGVLPGLGDEIAQKTKLLGLYQASSEQYQKKYIEADIARERAEKLEKRARRALRHTIKANLTEKDVLDAAVKYEMDGVDEDDEE